MTMRIQSEWRAKRKDGGVQACVLTMEGGEVARVGGVRSGWMVESQKIREG
jgi:hypothetical protein